jgi:hypothetical protein
MLNLVSSRCRPLAVKRMSASATEAPPTSGEIAAGAMALPSEVIDGNEIVILAIKPSMWQPFLDSAAWLVACCLAAVGVVWLGRPIVGLSVTATAQVILLVAAVRLGIGILRWVPTWYVLTNRRVLHICGIRKPRVESRLLHDIRDTCLDKMMLERFTLLGTITIRGEGAGSPPMEWRSIASPELIHEKMCRAIRDAKA